MELKPSDNAAPSGPMPPSGELDMGELWAAVLSYRWVVVLVTVLVGAATFLWSARQPRLYRGTCTIQYDPSPPQPLGRRFEDTGSVNYYWANRELFETQDRVIASRTVAEKVVRKFALNADPGFLHVPDEERDEFEPVPVWQAAQTLQSRVAVHRVRDTRLVEISVTSRDGERAQLLANAVADAYMEKSMEDRLGATASALEWLGTQLDSLKERLEGAELALHEFSEQHTELSVPLEDQKRIVAADITQLSASLTQARERHIELAARLNTLVSANAENPVEVGGSVVAADGQIESLRRGYGDLSTERAVLATSLGPEHPKVKALDARMAGLRQQLRDQVDKVVERARSDVREVSAVEAGLKEALADVNAAGLRLNLQEITYRRLERERNNASQLYGTILERTAEADLANAMNVSYVQIVDRALLPEVPVAPRTRFHVVVGTCLGLLLGLLLTLVLSRLDRTIRGVEEVEGLGVTVLGVVPKMTDKPQVRTGKDGVTYARERDMIVHEQPKSSAAECCRAIRTNLTFMGAGRTRTALAVTSANPREGKTTVALSIAITFAQSGKRVVIIDTDMRRPRLHRATGGTNARGVTSVLLGAMSIDEAVQDTPVPGLSLLACGPIPPNPSELLHSEEFADIIRQLRGKFDQLIFDSPPLAAVTDAAVLAPQVDANVLVASARVTSRDALASALRQLYDVRANVFGVVLNQVDLTERRYGYGGYYHYYRSEGYYATEEETSEQEQPPAAGA